MKNIRPELNAKDLLLLSTLRRNAREKLTTISRRTSIPVSTLHEKLKQYADSLIKKHTVLLDFNKLGYQCRAKVLVNAPKETKQELRSHLERHPNVNSAYKINNGYTYLLDVIFPHLDDLDKFIETLESKYDVTNTQTYYIIDELKREGFMTDLLAQQYAPENASGETAPEVKVLR